MFTCFTSIKEYFVKDIPEIIDKWCKYYGENFSVLNQSNHHIWNIFNEIDNLTFYHEEKKCLVKGKCSNYFIIYKNRILIPMIIDNNILYPITLSKLITSNRKIFKYDFNDSKDKFNKNVLNCNIELYIKNEYNDAD